MKEPMISATGIDGCNILAFDGERYARTVKACVKELMDIDKELALEYLKSMSGITIKMENCNATFDNSTREI